MISSRIAPLSSQARRYLSSRCRRDPLTLAIRSPVQVSCLSNPIPVTRPSVPERRLESHPIIGQYRFFHGSPRILGITPFLLADIGEGITECEIIEWFVKPGDHVEQFSKICEVQSDKAAVEITSRYDGVIKKLHYEKGAIAKVGSPLVDIEVEGQEESQPTETSTAAPSESVKEEKVKTASPVQTSAVDAAGERALTLATPAVRRVAKEHGVNLSLIAGTGPSGRILKGDVLAFVSGKTSSTLATNTPVTTSTTTQEEIVPLTPIQKVMFKTMTASLQIPHFGFSDEIILNNLSAYRKSINTFLQNNPAIVEKYGVKKVSYMPFFIKAASLALNQYPTLNAKLINTEDPASVKVVLRKSHNIGIAMDTPQGLIVPNVKNVETKSLLDIASDLERLKVSGKKGGISPADLKGGTFSLSNIGNIGGTVLHPVLVSTEVCIGAIGKVQRLPRFENTIDPATGTSKEIVVAKEILAVSFNADHRLIDGATMGRFVQVWKQYLEQPELFSLELR